MQKAICLLLTLIIVASCLYGCAMNSNVGETSNPSHTELMNAEHTDWVEESTEEGSSETSIQTTDPPNTEAATQPTEPPSTEAATQPTEPEVISATYSAYLSATTLTKADLSKKNTSLGTKYYYKDLSLLSEDVEWIESYLNKEGTVNQGAIYRKLAKLLEGYALQLNNGSSYSEYIFGETISSDEFALYADTVSEFITNKDTLYQVLKKFESLECVEGEFDFANNNWSFSIADLTLCAEEMQIGEEMLGYIFAMLDEYAPTITFDGNSCTFVYESLFDFDFE